MAGLLEAGQQLRQHAGLEGLGLVGIAASYQLVLLGHVGQVEELVECPGHRQQFVIVQITQGRAELFAGIASISFRAVTNILDLLQKFIAILVTNRVAEQLSQHMDIFTQTHIDIGHWPSPWRSSSAWHALLGSSRCL